MTPKERRRGAAVATVVVAVVLSGCGPGVRAGTPRKVEPVGDAVSSGPHLEWSVPLPGQPGAVAADDHGVVVTVGERSVVALAPGGAPRWSTDVEGAGLETPALDAATVLVSARTGADASAAGRFVALDRETGAILWADAFPGWSGPVALGGGRAVTVAATGVLTVRDARTGAVHWRSEVGGAVAPRGAVVVDGTTGAVATVAEQSGRWWLVLRDLDTGADRGGLDLGAGEPPSAVAGAGPGRLVLGSGRTREVLVVDLGAMRVRAAVPSGAGFDPSVHPAVEGGVAVLTDRLGGVTALDVGSGRVRWRAHVGAPVLDGRPAFTPGAVTIGDWERGLAVLDRADGRVRAGPPMTGLVSSVAGAGGRLVVALRLADPPRLEGWSGL